MKNVTFAIDDETWCKANLYAVEQNTNLTALVRDFLNSLGGRNPEAGRLLQLQRDTFARIDARLGAAIPSEPLLSREALYDRGRSDESRS